jgi:hypothetical protein
LGPGEKRFFGSGYKRVGQCLSGIRTDGSSEPGALVTARAGLNYPQDWSRKGAGSQLRPHLSSIDALVLAAQLAEIQLNHSRALTAEQQRHTWLCSTEVRAGTQPHEDLSDFPVLAQLRGTEDGRLPGGPLRSHYDCRIGSLKVRCTFEHAPGDGGRRNRPETVYATGDEALGPARNRHYGDGYKARRNFAEDVAVDLSAQRVRARQHVVPEPGDDEATWGAEAAYAPSVSQVDCMISIAQLAQVLLYNQDDLPRSSSNTLWMRRILIEADSPLRPFDGPIDAMAYTTKTRLLSMSDGLWRCSELAVDDFGGIHGSCSIAHRLPAAATA